MSQITNLKQSGLHIWSKSFYKKRKSDQFCKLLPFLISKPFSTRREKRAILISPSCYGQTQIILYTILLLPIPFSKTMESQPTVYSGVRWSI